MKLNCVKLKSDPFIIPFDFQFLDVVICSEAVESGWIRNLDVQIVAKILKDAMTCPWI